MGMFSQNENDTLLFPLKYKKGQRYTFKTVAGTTHTGYVINETRDVVTIENRNIHETLELNKNDIISAKPFPEKSVYQQDILGDNIHAGSYLLTGSAFEFEEGEVVSNNHWLILQNIEYAVNKNWAFTTNAIAFFPFSIGLKCSYRIGDMAHVGGNVFGMANLLSNDRSLPFLLGYGGLVKYTYGTSNKNLTLSGGVLGVSTAWLAIAASDVYVNVPFLSAGYCNRFSTNVAFVSECYYMPQTTTLFGGAGVKLVGNENYSWGFGLYTFLSTYNNSLSLSLKTVPIPYIGVGRRFN